DTIVRYVYKIDVINEDGKHKELEFSANKQLRKGAYLMLYVNKEGEVTSYDEVSKKDMPKDAS
ncbi:MAG: YxeA family protein, partial [Kurthia sp.]|nr:YxeA family protein [Kurthia sp.]